MPRQVADIHFTKSADCESSLAILIVTSGCGWIQRDSGPVEEIRPGDVIWFAPEEKHWHGASPTTAMSHIAIQEKLNASPVTWMEQASDDQYRK